MSIHFEKETLSFYIESNDLSYVFKVSEHGFLQHLYYGKKIARDDVSYLPFFRDRGQSVCLPTSKMRRYSAGEYLYECPTAHRGDYKECMIEVITTSGVRSSALKYVSHEILDEKPALCGMPSLSGGTTLKVNLIDEITGITVTLYYSVYDELSAIVRRAEITNTTTDTVKINRIYSASVDFYGKDWDVITLYGAHVRERQIERNRAHHGVFEASSSRGVSSGQMNPFMAIATPNCDENNGSVYGFNLVYSGDFSFKTSLDQDDNLRFVGGINDFGFEWTLAPSESFSSPEMVMVYSDNGLGEMSRTFHDLYRNYLINPAYVFEHRPIVINNWEATYFNFDTKKLCDIIDSVIGTGIDTVVLDDGWFGVRNNDKSGLGDWFINYDKLPNGLTPIIDHAHKNGMKFGLWFEPEMVNKDSDLYRAHPDWAIAINDVEPCPSRDQLVLDFSRDEVVDYIASSICKILDENAIDYVKWDMNRPLSEDWSSALKERSGELHHRYVLGVYKLCEKLVKGYPHIFFEGCASGGCRFDPAMAYYFPQIWTSDDTDAYERSRIQYGSSLCYPLSLQSCHVSAVPNHQTKRISSLKARGDIAHLGATGYELDTTQLSKADLDEIKVQVDQYKQMQDLVLRGDLYRLASPFEGNYFVEQLVSKDKTNSLITAMRTLSVPNGWCYRVYPKGLVATSTYEVCEINSAEKCSPLTFRATGSTIMYAGFPIYFDSGDFSTKTISIKMVK